MHTRYTATGTSGSRIGLMPRSGQSQPPRTVHPGPFDIARSDAGAASADMRSALVTALVAIYPVFASVALVLTLFAVRGSVV